MDNDRLTKKIQFLRHRRIFEFLGYDEAWEGHDDGLQVLRYNQSAAFIPHMDYMTDKSGTELYVRFCNSFAPMSFCLLAYRWYVMILMLWFFGTALLFPLKLLNICL